MSSDNTGPSSLITLEQSTQIFRLLSDSTRLRLMRLLEVERLSVAELTHILGLAQGRVSSHLAKLKEAGLVADQREGSSVFYQSALDSAATGIRLIYSSLSQQLADTALNSDAERAAQIVAERNLRTGWVDSVAGRMERHYSPGRTWEATARALCGLLDLGVVLDIGSGDGVLAELLASHAKRVTCVDHSQAIVEAAQERLSHFDNVQVEKADMHTLPFANQSFDQVFLMHVLPFSEKPETVLAEATRVLRQDGTLILVNLARHQHHATVAAYDHLNDGFTTQELEKLLREAGLNTQLCEITSRETRPPYFEVITAIGQRC